jgi:hypothetical protein
MLLSFVSKVDNRELYNLEIHGVKVNLQASGQIKIRIGIMFHNKKNKELVLTQTKKMVYFGAISVAEIDDNASYIYKSTKDRACKGVYFSIEIAK